MRASKRRLSFVGSLAKTPDQKTISETVSVVFIPAHESLAIFLLTFTSWDVEDISFYQLPDWSAFIVNLLECLLTSLAFHCWVETKLPWFSIVFNVVVVIIIISHSNICTLSTLLCNCALFSPKFYSLATFSTNKALALLSLVVIFVVVFVAV